MSNLELFNLYATRILAQLYDEFPVARGMVDEDIAFPPAERTGRLDGAPDIAHKIKVAEQTRFWLRDTGYLIEREGNTYRYVLSPKALEVLNASPEALAVKETLGNQMKKVAKDATTEGTKKVAADLMGQFIGSAVRSMIGAG
jgi:hypothetical protein